MRRAQRLLAVFATLGLLWAGAWRLAAEEEKTDKPAENVYAPKKGLSPEELRAYIERMQDAPAAIKERPGFADGIAEAAERILQSKPDADTRRFAMLTKLEALHASGDAGNQAADKKLFELAAALKDDADAKIAAEAKFYLLEQRVLAADELEPAKLPPLIDEVKKSLADQAIDARHQRIASATVKMINRAPDDDYAAKAYKELGQLLSKSDDKEVARYGQRIAEGGRPPTLIGKKMELTGATLDGDKFDIARYKGKVVLVDFWATWCGPCRASLPGLIKTYERYHDQGLEVVGPSMDDDLDKLGTFLAEAKLPWVVLIGEKGDDEMKFPLFEKYNVTAIPATFLVDRDGKIVATDLRGDALDKKLEELLAKAANAGVK